MKYRLFFSALLCDRFVSGMMRSCALCEDVGISQTLSFDTTTKPTKEYIEKMTNVLNSTKDEKSLRQYYSLVKHIRTEVIEDEKI